MVGIAVNVTDVPEQIIFPGLAAILTDGVNSGFTVIVMLLLETVVGLAQVALEVKERETTSLFERVVVV